MCTSDFSLKLIAAACLLIIVTDSFVLQQILEKQDFIHLTSDADVYQNCYKPQIRMRVVFTSYAINSAAVCFVLTMALMCCDEMSEWFDKIVNWIAEYMYLAFGPVLLTFCLFGLSNMGNLSHECTPHKITDHLNLMDVTILLICTCLSFVIVFVYALQYTNRLAEKDLGDEHSVFYQLFSTYLNRQRQKYHAERKRRLLRLHGPQAADIDDGLVILDSGMYEEQDDDDEEPSRIRATSESMPLKFDRSDAGSMHSSSARSATDRRNSSYTDLNASISGLNPSYDICEDKDDSATVNSAADQTTTAYTGL